MAIQISGNNAIDNNRKGLFNSANLGSYTPANRPTGAATGDVIYNSTNEYLEVWNGSAWVAACKGPEIVATGGNEIVTYRGSKIHIFTSPGTFSVTSAPPTSAIRYFVISGGGGGGGAGPGAPGGGGGAGGGIVGILTASSPSSYTIGVGAGAGGSYHIGPYIPAGTFFKNNGNPSWISGPIGVVTTSGGGSGGLQLSGPEIMPVPSGGQGAVATGNPGGCGGGGANVSNIQYLGGSGNTGPTNPIQGYPGGGAAFGSQRPGSGGGISTSGTGWYDQQTGGGDPAITMGGAGICLDWGIPSSYGQADAKGSLGTRWFGGGGTSVQGTGRRGLGQDGANSGGGGMGWGTLPPAAPFPSLIPRGNGNSGIVIFAYSIYQ